MPPERWMSDSTQELRNALLRQEIIMADWDLRFQQMEKVIVTIGETLQILLERSESTQEPFKVPSMPISGGIPANAQNHALLSQQLNQRISLAAQTNAAQAAQQSSELTEHMQRWEKDLADAAPF